MCRQDLLRKLRVEFQNSGSFTFNRSQYPVEFQDRGQIQKKRRTGKNLNRCDLFDQPNSATRDYLCDDEFLKKLEFCNCDYDSDNSCTCDVDNDAAEQSNDIRKR